MEKQYTQEEQQLQFSAFTAETALELGNFIIAYAKEQYPMRGIAVHIEKNRQPLFTHMMEGTTLWNQDWYLAKKNVVDHFGKSSAHVAAMFAENDWDFATVSGLDTTAYRPVGGSFPLIVKNAGVIGSLTVAGLSAAEDHACLVDALAAFFQKTDVK